MALQSRRLTIFLLLLLCVINVSVSKKYKDEEKPTWAKKDIRDYSDADLERLLDQWEEDEEPLPEDEKPEYLRKPPPLDLNNLDTSNPEEMLQASKKYQTLMMFVSVANNPTRARTEQLAKIWETSLWSNHIQTERYIVADNRLLLLFKEGSQAWPAKNFLLEMEEVKEIQLEGQTFHGKKPDIRNVAVKDEL